jgi:WD40 repeat protein
MAIKKKYEKKKSELPIGLIVGAAVGGIAVVAIILGFVLSSAPKNSTSQEAPKHMAAATNQPAPGRSEQGIVPKRADTRVSSATEAKTVVENGPKLSQAIEWMLFSPTGDHFFALPTGQNKGLLWAVPGWQETKASSPECNYFSVPAAFSRNGRFLACQDGGILRIWNITTSPASLVNSIPAYRPDADDPSWNGVFWASDGTLVTWNPQGGFQFLSQDKEKGAILTAIVGSGKHGLLQLGNKQFVGDILTPGTLQIKDVAIAPNGRAFGVLKGNRDKKPGFFTWLIPSATRVGFLSFDLAGEPDTWECNGITISQDGSQLAASLYYPGTMRPPMPKIWMASIWHSGSPPKKIVLQGNEKDLVDFRFRAFSPNGWRAATSGATSFPTAGGNVVKRFAAIWDTASGKKLWQVDDVLTKEVFFTEDGRTLVTGAADTSAVAGGGRFVDNLDPKAPQTVDFWDVETGQRRCQFRDRGIQSLAVSPDGTTLVTAYPRLAEFVWSAGVKGIGPVRGFAGEQGTALAVHRFPANQEQLSDEILEKEARERRQKFLNGAGGQKSGTEKE